jgi:hypothetical protein
MSNAVWKFLRIETKDNCGEARAILLRISQCNRSSYDYKDLYIKTQSSSTLDTSDPNLKTIRISGNAQALRKFQVENLKSLSK